MVRSVDGQGFAFEPRSVVKQPKAFGITLGDLEPADGIDSRDPRYRAAMLQHRVMVAVRSEVRRVTGKSPVQFAERFGGRGLSADRVRRVLRGETMAQLTDLAFWAGHSVEVAAVISNYTIEWGSPRSTTTSNETSGA